MSGAIGIEIDAAATTGTYPNFEKRTETEGSPTSTRRAKAAAQAELKWHPN